MKLKQKRNINITIACISMITWLLTMKTGSLLSWLFFDIGILFIGNTVCNLIDIGDEKSTN